jgi:hypothetical protein
MDQQWVKMRSIATAWGATTCRGPKVLLVIGVSPGSVRFTNAPENVTVVG